MPNHVKNIVMFHGAQETIDELLESIKGDSEHPYIDFNRIVPMPEELSMDDLWDDYETGKITRPQYHALLSGRKAHNRIKYGFEDWYDWSITNWGTKWNAYEQEMENRNGVNLLTFWTAWTMPHEFFVALSKKYPTVSINVCYADEDIGNNCGIRWYWYGGESGEIDGETCGGVRFACTVWGSTPEEYGYRYNEETGEYEYSDD